MSYGHIVRLGLTLVVGSGTAFLLSWIVLECFKGSARIGIERAWFRCLAAGFYVGLAILFACALGSLIQDTVKGIKQCF